MDGPLVVGYDGTDGARAALAEAERLAPARSVLPVVVAFAYHPGAVGGEVSDLSASLRERGEALLAEAVDELRTAGVEASGQLLHTKPGEGLAELAEERDARMIVVGSYGERPLKGAARGLDAAPAAAPPARAGAGRPRLTYVCT